MFIFALFLLSLIYVKGNSDISIINDDIDLLIIGTSDGVIHALDSEKNEKWSLDTGGPTASVYNSEHRQYSVLPSADGSIYINSREGMAKTSVKARMIAEKAPFVSIHDNLIFTGQKSSRILGVDLRNGRIVHDTGASNSKLPRSHDGLLISKIDSINL
jgi:hypothetical protein